MRSLILIAAMALAGCEKLPAGCAFASDQLPNVECRKIWRLNTGNILSECSDGQEYENVINIRRVCSEASK